MASVSLELTDFDAGLATGGASHSRGAVVGDAARSLTQADTTADALCSERARWIAELARGEAEPRCSSAVCAALLGRAVIPAGAVGAGLTGHVWGAGVVESGGRSRRADGQPVGAYLARRVLTRRDVARTLADGLADSSQATAARNTHGFQRAGFGPVVPGGCRTRGGPDAWVFPCGKRFDIGERSGA